MKTKFIGWSDRLDDLYSIADDTGSDAQRCDDEWWDLWLPGQRIGFDDVVIEPIPSDEWDEFCEYAGRDE